MCEHEGVAICLQLIPRSASAPTRRGCGLPTPLLAGKPLSITEQGRYAPDLPVAVRGGQRASIPQMLSGVRPESTKAVEDRRAQPRLSVVIPVYNEVGTIAEVVRRVREVGIEKEILIVDDGSTDGTRQVLERLLADNVILGRHSRSGWTSDLRVFLQSKNCGKGAALRRGFQE